MFAIFIYLIYIHYISTVCIFFSVCFEVWEGNSVWDLPIDTAAQGPALEQLQQLEKAKVAKVRNSVYFTIWHAFVFTSTSNLSFYSSLL